VNLPRFAVRNPVTANLIMVAILVGGAFAGFGLRREMFPNVDPEAVVVTVAFPGATPEEVERLVARRIERAVEGLEDVEEVVSEVFEGLAAVRVDMDEGSNRDRVLSDVRSAIDDVRPELPAGAEEPEIRQLRPILPVISVVVFGDVSEESLRGAAKRVRDDLLDLEAVSEATLAGVRDREIWVEIRPDKLEEHGLTFEEVGRVLARSNLDLPAGQLKSGSGNIRVRTLGERDRAAEIAALLVRSRPDGSGARLGDLAAVRETFEDTVERGRYQGERAAMVTVFKNPEEDAVEIAEKVKDYVRAHTDSFGDAIRLETARDLSRFISQRLDLMVRNARLGLLLVVLVLGFFLEVRVAFWVAVGLAVSFLGTFLLMSIVGVTVNLISMFGLIVVLGLLVDDAIVVAENVFTKRREGMPPERAAIVGTTQVAGPVVAAVLTTMAAFSPLGFLEGRVGAFLGVLPVVVICALGVSLVEAFVVLPAHLAHRDRPWGRGRLGRLFQRLGRAKRVVLEDWVPSFFARTLRFGLAWRYVILAGALAILLVTAGVVQGGLVGFVLLGSMDAETVEVELEMAPGTSEEETDAVLARIERLARAHPEVDTCFAVVGTAFRDGQRRNVSDPATVGQITFEMRAADERAREGLRRTDDVVNDLRRHTADIPGVGRLSFSARGGGPQGADIEVRLRARELGQVSRATDHVRDVLATYEGVTEVYDDLIEGKLELRYSLRDDARALDFTTRDLALQLRHALFGFEVQDLQDEDEEVTVRVLLPETERKRIEDLSRLRIATGGGGRVPLEEVADLTTERGYATLTRVDGKRAFTVFAQVDAAVANVDEITADLEGRLADLGERFPGVTFSFEGAKQETRESLAGLRVGFGVAILLIYLIVAILFRSYVQPLLVMLAIPISFVGVVWGHVVMGHPLTLLSLIGAVALAGIVVNDSLILVDLINRKRREDRLGVFTAVLQGSRGRLRPVLLTSVTTIAGLAPIMLEQSFQAQFLIPMAISIVFGLAFATVLTLVLVPTFYLVIEDGRALLRWLWYGPRTQPALERGR
jgi:multidrug efflux pump subunit AcrB